MCVIAIEHLPPAIAADAVQIVLSDHHLWGGLRQSALLGGITETFGLGLSMHSNSHLGVSLAAMVHLAAATPNLTYACDTHYPWKTQDVVRPGVLDFDGGSIAVPTGPGLGVELDRDLLGELHEQYLSCGVRRREDTVYMRSYRAGLHVEHVALVAESALVSRNPVPSRRLCPAIRSRVGACVPRSAG